mmetsp:Transcript_14620/g.32831  ORF Transcript_14620/g.32831 Transcript_14620/m.32831 type:complete len:221 (+) Transcript_14620:644-1306(+)
MVLTRRARPATWCAAVGRRDQEVHLVRVGLWREEGMGAGVWEEREMLVEVLGETALSVEGMRDAARARICRSGLWRRWWRRRSELSCNCFASTPRRATRRKPPSSERNTAPCCCTISSSAHTLVSVSIAPPQAYLQYTYKAHTSNRAAQQCTHTHDSISVTTRCHPRIFLGLAVSPPLALPFAVCVSPPRCRPPPSQRTACRAVSSHSPDRQRYNLYLYH